MENITIIKKPKRSLTSEESIIIKRLARDIKINPIKSYIRKYFVKVYLLYSNKDIIGFASLDGDFISSFAIDKARRGKGYGQLLLNYVKDDIDKPIHLDATESSFPFWINQGFKVVNEKSLVWEKV